VAALLQIDGVTFEQRGRGRPSVLVVGALDIPGLIGDQASAEDSAMLAALMDTGDPRARADAVPRLMARSELACACSTIW